MKISVSVPDDLWEAATEVYGGGYLQRVSASSLVQDALSAYVALALEYEVEAVGGYEPSVSFS